MALRERTGFLAAMLALAAAINMWTAAADVVSDGQVLAGRAIEAYDAGRFADAADLFAKALALRPNHPGLTIRLARASLRAGRTGDAMRALDAYAAMGLNLDVRHADWQALAGTPSWRDLADRFAENARPKGRPTIVATIDEPDVLAEGVAFDPATRRLYVGDVHQRRIFAIAADGTVTTLVDRAAHGLFGAFGLALHERSNTLWAASSALPQAHGLTAEEKGRAGVFAFDLGGKLKSRVLLPVDGREHALGDLTLSAEGEVFLTDAFGAQVYRLKPGGTALEQLLASDEFHSPQGIVLSADARKLAISDYSNGIHIAERSGAARTLLAMPRRTTLHGIDGMVRHGRDIIAVQNGIDPQRVIRIRLDAAWTAIEGVDVLAANLAEMDEPTLATLAGADLLIIGNGQWSRFADDGAIKGEPPLAPTRILRLPLPPARP